MTVFHYDAIVFDLDGTLIDSTEIKTGAFGKLYEIYGELIVEKVVAWHLQNEGVSRFNKFRYWHEHYLQIPYTQAIGETLSRTFNSLVTDAIIHAQYMEGALEFLNTYYKKLPFFVASGTPESELREIIMRREMQFYFQGVYGTPASKADILHKIMRDYHWQPERILMIGDAYSDWEGAQTAGVHFLGVQTRKKQSFPAESSHITHFNQLSSYIISSNLGAICVQS